MINPIIDALIWLNIYGYYVTAVFVPATYYIMVNLFQFPMITNKIHELVLIATPEKVIIKKITNRYMPFFEFKKGLYWLDDPAADTQSLNQLHPYITEVNQPITKMERRPNKVNDVITNQSKMKQIGNHKIMLLKNLKKHLIRHWTLVLDIDNNVYALSPSIDPKTNKAVKQPLKVNLYHTLGIYIQKTIKIPKEEIIEGSGGTKQILQAITTQSIIEQLKYVQEHSYYSSHYAFTLLNRIRHMERTRMVRRRYTY